MEKDYKKLLSDYLESAYAYETGDGDVIMSDFEWDTLGDELQRNWDKFDSPLKQFCDKDYLGVTAGTGAIDWHGYVKYKNGAK